MSPNENAERMAEDNARINKLLKTALSDLSSRVKRIHWNQEPKDKSHVFLAILSPIQKTELEVAEYHAELALQGKSPKDAEREVAEGKLEAARQKVRDAEAEVARLQAEAIA